MNQTRHLIADQIAVTVHAAQDASPGAVIVLCHGFCGTQDVLLPAFVEAFVSAGFAAVTFDYRGFGQSGGERGRLVPAMQVDDVLAVVGWVKAHFRLAEGRIGLWGTSLGGCNAVVAARNSVDVGCLVAQMPFADGEQATTGAMDAQRKGDFIAGLERMDAKRQAGGREMFVAVTRILDDPQSRAFFEANVERFPDLNARIPFLTVLEILRFKPRESAASVRCPALVVVASEDAVNKPAEGIALFDAIGSAAKSLHVEQGARHYDLYDGEHFQRVVQVEIDWFQRHLPANTR